MHVSSMYLLQNRGGVWKVDSASCSTSSITRFATTTNTGDPFPCVKLRQLPKSRQKVAWQSLSSENPGIIVQLYNSTYNIMQYNTIAPSDIHCRQ